MSPSITLSAPVPENPITSVADAVAAVAKLFTPKEIENVSQDYETDAQNRLDQLASIESQPDSISRADQYNTFFKQLCLDAKRPIGELSGKLISLPVEYVHSLGEIAIDDIRAGQYIAPVLRQAGTPVQK